MTDLTPLLDDPASRDLNYFLTDHHWTIGGGYLAYEQIAKELEDAGIPIGTDDRRWHRITAELPFYGTEMRKLPKNFTAVPDVFWYEEPDGGFRARICEEDVCETPIVDQSYLKDPDKLANRYRALLGPPRANFHIHNSDPAASGTVVMLTDSYGYPVAVRLAERVRDLYIVDERKWEGEPVGRYVSSVNPDAVVFLHNHVSLLSQEFNPDIWRDAGD